MQTRPFGRTGVELTRLGFGAMRLPITKDEHGKIGGLDESAEIVARALDAGINYVDSAPGYGHRESETAVGLAIAGRPRDGFHLSTKYPVKNDCGECFRLRLELSLRKLGTDYVDFYHFWGMSWKAFRGRVTNEGGPLEAARKAKEEGLIRHISFSCHDTPENMIRIIDSGEFESMLVQYNLLDRKNEPALAHAHARGLGTVAMGPVGGGRLGTPSEVISEATGISSTAEIALRFVFANPELDVAISGMENVQQVEENVATAERGEALSSEELAKIDELVEQNKKLLDLPCTGCGYCTPCPKGVAIPEIFQLYQWHEAFGLKEPAKKRYAGLGHGWQEKKKPVRECVACGECEEKCPQKIAIAERLKEAEKVLAAGASA